MIVAFSGIDGSGKSTWAAYTAERLGQQGYEVRLLHLTQWTWVYRLGERMGRSGAAGAGQRKGGGGWLRRLVALLDVLRFWLLAWPSRRVLVCDRTFLDLAVTGLYTGAYSPRFVRWYQRLARRPTRLFLLDVSPTLAQMREGEHALAYYEQKRALYLQLAPQWTAVLLPTDDRAATQAALDGWLAEMGEAV